MKMTLFYQAFGPSLGVTHRQAYALQEALQGLEGFGVGRPGPGGGVPATPAALSYFLIAAMVGGPMREAKIRMYRWSAAVTEGRKAAFLKSEESDDRRTLPKCPLTGEHQFGSAMKVILANPEFASMVEQISVIEEWPEAAITFRCGDDFMVSRFIDEGGKQHATRATMTGAIHTLRSVGGWLINQIAMDVANDSSEPSPVEQEINK